VPIENPKTQRCVFVFSKVENIHVQEFLLPNIINEQSEIEKKQNTIDNKRKHLQYT
jgi:hypothetical protein